MESLETKETDKKYFCRSIGATSTPIRARRDLFGASNVGIRDLSDISPDDSDAYRLEVSLFAS